MASEEPWGSVPHAESVPAALGPGRVGSDSEMWRAGSCVAASTSASASASASGGDEGGEVSEGSAVTGENMFSGAMSDACAMRRRNPRGGSSQPKNGWNQNSGNHKASDDDTLALENASISSPETSWHRGGAASRQPASSYVTPSYPPRTRECEGVASCTEDDTLGVIVEAGPYNCAPRESPKIHGGGGVGEDFGGRGRVPPDTGSSSNTRINNHRGHFCAVGGQGMNFAGGSTLAPAMIDRVVREALALDMTDMSADDDTEGGQYSDTGGGGSGTTQQQLTSGGKSDGSGQQAAKISDANRTGTKEMSEAVSEHDGEWSRNQSRLYIDRLNRRLQDSERIRRAALRLVLDLLLDKYTTQMLGQQNNNNNNSTAASRGGGDGGEVVTRSPLPAARTPSTPPFPHEMRTPPSPGGSRVRTPPNPSSFPFSPPRRPFDPVVSSPSSAPRRPFEPVVLSRDGNNVNNRCDPNNLPTGSSMWVNRSLEPGPGSSITGETATPDMLSASNSYASALPASNINQGGNRDYRQGTNNKGGDQQLHPKSSKGGGRLPPNGVYVPALSMGGAAFVAATAGRQIAEHSNVSRKGHNHEGGSRDNRHHEGSLSDGQLSASSAPATITKHSGRVESGNKVETNKSGEEILHRLPNEFFDINSNLSNIGCTPNSEAGGPPTGSDAGGGAFAVGRLASAMSLVSFGPIVPGDKDSSSTVLRKDSASTGYGSVVGGGGGMTTNSGGMTSNTVFAQQLREVPNHLSSDPHFSTMVIGNGAGAPHPRRGPPLHPLGQEQYSATLLEGAGGAGYNSGNVNLAGSGGNNSGGASAAAHYQHQFVGRPDLDINNRNRTGTTVFLFARSIFYGLYFPGFSRA